MKKIAVALMSVVLGVGMTATLSSPAQAAEPAAAKAKIGYTRVVVAPKVYNLVANAGITPAAVRGAKAGPFKKTIQAKFPSSGYNLKNVRIKHTGGLKLSAGDRKIVVRGFNIDLARQRVSGKVNGSIGNAGRVDLFKIRESNRPGYGLVRLTLTKTGADALNKTFGVKAFKENGTFGYASPKPFARF